MRIEKRTETVTKEIYIAKDGQEFTNEKECLIYEWRLDATAIYLLEEGGGRVREVFSTYEEAMANSSKYHHVVEVYLDERTFFKNLNNSNTTD